MDRSYLSRIEKKIEVLNPGIEPQEGTKMGVKDGERWSREDLSRLLLQKQL